MKCDLCDNKGNCQLDGEKCPKPSNCKDCFLGKLDRQEQKKIVAHQSNRIRITPSIRRYGSAIQETPEQHQARINASRRKLTGHL